MHKGTCLALPKPCHVLHGQKYEKPACFSSFLMSVRSMAPMQSLLVLCNVRKGILGMIKETTKLHCLLFFSVFTKNSICCRFSHLQNLLLKKQKKCRSSRNVLLGPSPVSVEASFLSFAWCPNSRTWRLVRELACLSSFR